MNKLEIKHLAKRLPYRLKVLHYGKEKKMTTGTGSSNNWVSLRTILNMNTDERSENCKILLRPLSSLTKEITHEGETFVPMQRLEGILFNRDAESFGGYLSDENRLNILLGMADDLPHWIAEKLLEWHFAIDIPDGTWIEIKD